MLGRDVDRAIAHFEAKLAQEEKADGEVLAAAQALVNLLARVGRVDSAIDVAAAHFKDVPETALSCPSVSQLCQRAGLHERLATIARTNGDLVNFTAARLQSRMVPG